MVAFGDKYCSVIKSLESTFGPIGTGAKDDTRLFVNTSENSVGRFIRTACKMGVLGSDEKSGCPGVSE